MKKHSLLTYPGGIWGRQKKRMSVFDEFITVRMDLLSSVEGQQKAGGHYGGRGLQVHSFLQFVPRE